MKLLLITTDVQDPYRNLALEEYLTERIGEDEVCFFLWQNARTVVIGRNQDPWSECRIETMKEEGCTLARRISGGGAVFHDLGNLNFTFVARDEHYDVSKQTEVILRAMRMLGLAAEKNGRNDLTIDGRKFSGHAYYRSNGRCYHHGTIMIHVNGEDLAKYLNVSGKKLKSKGVKSVRSRVINLRDLKPELTVPEVVDALKRAFLAVYAGASDGALPDVDGMVILPDGAEVEVLMADRYYDDPDYLALVGKYSSDDWLYGRRIPVDAEIHEKLEWGEVRIHLHIVGGVIEECRIYSDSLETDIFPLIEKELEGKRYDGRSLLALAETTPAGSACSSSNLPELHAGIRADVLRLIGEQV